MSQEETRLLGEQLLRSMEWAAPAIEPNNVLGLKSPSKSDTSIILYRIKGLGAAEARELRSGMTNVLSAVANSSATFLYILTGSRDQFSIHVGVSAALPLDMLKPEADKLRASIAGNLMGSLLTEDSESGAELDVVNDSISRCQHFGVFTGIPTQNQSQQGVEETDFQGVERLANSLSGEDWQLIISAHAPADESIKTIIDEVYDLSTELSFFLKQSFQQGENSSTQTSRTDSVNDTTTSGKSRTTGSGKSGPSWSESENVQETGSSSKQMGVSTVSGSSDGTSWSFTRERTDRRASEWHKHLSETMLERFRLGASKGMFVTSIYIGAKHGSVYDRLSSGLVSIFQGDKSTMTPLKSHYLFSKEKIPDAKNLSLSNFSQLSQSTCGERPRAFFVAHSMPMIGQGQYAVGSWLNVNELAFVAALPAVELPGIPVRKTVGFGLNADPQSPGAIVLGNIKQQGRSLPATIALPLKSLNYHVFVTGVTGAGKTTTCMKLLLESGLNFMVIEPAKTEYRALHPYFSKIKENRNIEYYSLNREDISVFRLNPFEVISPEINLASHIQILTGTLTAVFPMEASMPYMVEEAIIGAYEQKGWDIHSGENFISQSPWSGDDDVWPTFSEMIECLRKVIRSKGLGKEFEEKYEGSLVSRLSNLTRGTKGRMLNCRRSINFDALLDRCVVIELDELKDEKDKALIMGLLLTRLADSVKIRHRKNPDFQHVTLLEEAHRLLSKPEPGEGDARKHGVEMFANLLAEVRKYGAGLIVADQIPGKLIPDVIKNTNTKIVHRLFAADDRAIMGDSMGLSDEQKDFLPMLQPGETIIYRGGWHEAVWMQVGELVKTDGVEISDDKIKECGAVQFRRDANRLSPLFCVETAGLSNVDAMIMYSKSTVVASAMARLCSVYESSASKFKEATSIAPIVIYINISIARTSAELGIPLDRFIKCCIATMLDERMVAFGEKDNLYNLMSMILNGNDAEGVVKAIKGSGYFGSLVEEIAAYAEER